MCLVDACSLHASHTAETARLSVSASSKEIASGTTRRAAMRALRGGMTQDLRTACATTNHKEPL